MKNAVLITGSTGGIGQELCRVFAGHGYNVVLVSRDEKRLNALARELEDEFKIKTYVIVKNLSNEESANEIFDEIKKQKIEVKILCNNAGAGLFGEFLDGDLEKNKQIIGVNISCLVSLCHLFGNEMKKKGGGKILNIASIGAFFSGPLVSTYFASKAFVLSFSEALALELKPFNISVCAVCPGTTKTAFFEKAGSRLQNKATDPKKVALFAYKKLMKGKAVAIYGVKNKLAVFFGKFLPRKRQAKMSYNIQKKRK